MLATKGIQVGTHIAKLKDIEDIPFDETNLKRDIELLQTKKFAALDDKRGEAMIAMIMEARQNQDSIGGILDTAVIGLEAGLGEPEFDSIESLLSHAWKKNCRSLAVRCVRMAALLRFREELQFIVMSL